MGVAHPPDKSQTSRITVAEFHYIHPGFGFNRLYHIKSGFNQHIEQTFEVPIAVEHDLWGACFLDSSYQALVMR